MLTKFTPDLPPAPAVSVLIPAFRCHDVIGDAIDAVMRQTYRDFEIIVVNDGCPETRALEQVLTHYRHHINYMRRPHGGPGAARNTALQFARGRYLAFLDADDVWLPEYLKRLVTILESDRTLDVVYCDATVTGDGEGGKRFMDIFPSRGPVTLDRLLTGRCSILTSGALARAARVRETGPFDESLELAEDYELWSRMLLEGARFTYLCEPLVNARLLPTRLCADPERADRAVLQVLRKLEGRRDLTDMHRAAIESARQRIGRSLDRQGRGRSAFRRWMRDRAIQPGAIHRAS